MMASHPESLPTAEIVPIRRASLHDEVVSRVRDMIVEGQFSFGTRIHEGRLCEQLGISRTPLREALKVLATEGLVDLSPNRGAIVREVTPKDMRDMLRVLGQLEALAGELACANASEADIAAIHEMHQRMMEHYTARNRMEYFKLNQAIHSAFVRLADNPTLQTMHETLQARIKRIRYLGNDHDTQWHDAADDHEKMIAALLKRDGPALGRVLRFHLERTWERVRNVLGVGEL
ncbi:MAG: GntR family transcriptional regulator [Alphaproteobacteria bacterium]|nr:GntR family transcriptional regulator [Reyranella sp.]MBN9496568.1 GntR family transcriptional regulator [Alphaproteobacteria bacterium]